MAEKKVKKTDKNTKKRNWAFVLWLDSAPEDWREQLQQTGLRCAISPYHDKDVHDDGTPKKPHYHVILCYEGPTSYNVVNAFTNGKLGQSIPQPLESIRGYYRYFTHMDDPDKYQYDSTEIQNVNGFSITDFVELTKSEITKIKRQVQGFIRDNDVVEYADLLDCLMDADGLEDMYEVAANNTVLFTAYIASRRFSIERKAKEARRGKEKQLEEDRNNGTVR